MRANASLQTVARRAQRLALAALSRWERLTERERDADPREMDDLRRESGAAWRRYSELRELAEHVSRHANVKLVDELRE